LSKIYLSVIIFIINLNFYSNLYSSDQDYCVGYLEEVYWSLDPIEEIETRDQIILFFNENFEGAKALNYDLYYDSQSKQFLTDLNGVDISQYKKVNYPNFEILVLDAYINLFKGDGTNYCPAFWSDCSEESLSSFFQASEDFSQSWNGEENVMEFLEDHFVNHYCTMYLDTSINQKLFTSDLNILIDQLTK
jgi:hypothetical protein